MERQTTFAKPGRIAKKWHTVDATDQALGRLASKIATVLMGKHRPDYTPFADTGDFVVVLNVSKIKITGNKAQNKFRQTYSRYPGGQKQRSWGELLARKPEELLEIAVRRMLPKSNLGQDMLRKLKVYRGCEHPHAAQNPQPLT